MNDNNIQLMIPAECWFDAPRSTSRNYFNTFADVAHALHQAVRDELPGMFFADPAKLADCTAAYPMLVFKASRTCRNRQNQCCWDVLDTDGMSNFFRFALRNLGAGLKYVRGLAANSGKTEIAAAYAIDAMSIVKRTRFQMGQRQLLNNMLVVEGQLLLELLDLARPCPVELRAKRIATFNKRWNQLLRRFCGSFDFTAAAPALLRAATAALLQAQERATSKAMDLDWAA